MNFAAEREAFRQARLRCSNPNHPFWKDYGGRGIEFRFKSFEKFFAELGPRPKGLTLDRKENDGHYEVGNVRWATRKEQAQNRRINVEALSIAGRRGMRLHGNPGTFASRSKAGRQRIKMLGDLGTKEGRILASHRRWHVRRNIVNPNCKLCVGPK